MQALPICASVAGTRLTASPLSNNTRCISHNCYGQPEQHSWQNQGTVLQKKSPNCALFPFKLFCMMNRLIYFDEYQILSSKII
jgi:hypothetical protein